MGLQRVGHNWATSFHFIIFLFFHDLHLMLDGWLFPLAISAVSFFWKLLYLQSLTQIHVLLFSCSVVSDSFLTPWTAACQASLSFPVPEFAQIHVHWVGDAIQLSHPLLSPSPPALHFSQHQGPFPVSQFFTSGGQSIGASASAAVLLVNIQGWFPLELTDLISLQSNTSKEDEIHIYNGL